MRLLAGLVLAAACCACAPAHAPPARAAAADTPPAEALLRAIRSPDTSLDAANATLAAFADAVARRDAAAMRSALGEGAFLVLPWPGDEERERPTPFLERAAWRRRQAGTPEAWLALWSRVDEATLELHPRRPDAVTGRVTGLDAQGRPMTLEVHGAAQFVARRALRLDGSSLTALRPMTTDVSVAAGVERPDPSLMERGGRGLLSHGAAAADVDGDGDMDVFATGMRRHALFLNRGDGTFEDAADRAHVAVTDAPACAPLFLDADGDGDQDLFVSGLGHQSLFENRLVPEGRLDFRDVSAAAGVQVERAAFSVAAGDVTGDGRPDLAVACYGDYGAVVPDSWVDARNGQPSLLFVNEGGLRFREASAELGCADPRWGYSALVADIDDDRRLDVVFANDFGGAVGVYVHDGERLRDASAEAGLDAPSYGMGLSLGDWNRDGRLDLHVTKASSAIPERALGEHVPPVVAQLAAGNSLYARTPNGRVGPWYALVRSFPTGWSWGGGFADLDGDGWTDLHVPGGFLTGAGTEDTDDLFWKQVCESQLPGGQTMAEFFALQVPAIVERGASFAGHERDAVFLNVRGTFVDVSAVSGLDSVTDGRAAVHADFDDDGDPDVFLRAMHDRAHLLFRNDVGSGNGFLRVALRGTASGTDACGAVVRLVSGEDVVAQAKLCGSGFLSQDDPRLLFGLGDAPESGRIEVTWPSGATQSFASVPARTSLLLVEGEPEAHVVKEIASRLGGPGGPP